MKYKGLLFICAAIVLAVAVPLPDDSRVQSIPDFSSPHYSPVNEHQETAEIEVFSSLLQFLGNILPNGGTGDDSSSALVKMFLQLFQQFLTTNGNGGGREEESEAEIEGFRSFLSKALNLVDRKLRPKDRTSEEDQEAVDNPTKWTDLGRNVLRELRTKLDGSNPETAEIEDLSNFLQLLSNVKPNGGTGDGSFALVNTFFQLFQQLLASNGNGGANEEESVAEIEGLRSFLSKALELVDRKLKPKDRTSEEDQEAVDNPTKWTDLGRNALRELRQKLDGTNPEIAEMEDLSNFLQLLSNILPNGGTGDGSSAFVNMLLQFIQQLFTANGNGGGSEEESMAEIEGFRSFLGKALKLVNRKLKPSDRTPEEDQQAVDNPTKWTDLGRNLIRSLREKLDRDDQPASGKETAKGATSTRIDYY